MFRCFNGKDHPQRRGGKSRRPEEALQKKVVFFILASVTSVNSGEPIHQHQSILASHESVYFRFVPNRTTPYIYTSICKQLLKFCLCEREERTSTTQPRYGKIF